MLIKKEKIEDLEFMDVEPEDEELRSIVMEEEDKAKKKAEEEYDFEVKRAEKKRLNEAMKRVEVSGRLEVIDAKMKNMLLLRCHPDSFECNLELTSRLKLLCNA